MHWAARYIGRPYAKEAEGPDAFYCWSWVRWAQAHHFGRDLPKIPNPDDLLAQARLFRDHPERCRWSRVETPAEGDLVEMGSARRNLHIGIWTAADGGKVVHCDVGCGVVAQRPHELEAHAWAIKGYWRFVGDSP